MSGRARFLIVGSGWRSLYYVRIAKALPQAFELCAMLCRTQEKAVRISRENGIRTSTSAEECIAMKPDFVVVAVDKVSLAPVAMEWARRGFCVLMETPAAVDVKTLESLWNLHRDGARLVVCEQYRRYPENIAVLNLLDSGILGEVGCANVSLAHDYHGSSLMRAFLKQGPSCSFTVRARSYSFPTARTLTRTEEFFDGQLVSKVRTVASFEFADGKVGLYDFDGEQYRSPIRRNTLKLQGTRGEVIDRTVHHLDGSNHPVSSNLEFKSRMVQTGSDNPNLRSINVIEDIVFEGRSLYSPLFEGADLAQDESAIASMMKDTCAYARGLGPSPYPLEEALTDAYMALLLKQAADSGETVSSESQSWF